MKSHTNFFIVAVILACSASVGLARGTATTEIPTPPADANAVSIPSFPYTAEITGDNVYIRSGAGTNYYDCGKLNKGDKVKVVSSQFSWSRIVPPPGSFSWISVQYVSIDPGNAGVGIVTGDTVRVYAGSDIVRPIHSTTLQLKLNRGEKVKLLGEQADNYYKIAPPTGAFLWVSTNFTKPLAPGPIGPSIVETRGPNDIVITVKVSVEAEKLKEYRALQNQLKAERAKPMNQQNYTKLKKAFSEIADNKEAGKAARYCQSMVGQIERFELASSVSKTVLLQDKELQQIQERIDKARATRLAQAKNLGRFAVVGKLETSNIYGTEAQLKHYRIIDKSGKTICYARPSAQLLQMDLSKVINRKVGLVGTIKPHPQTASALVQFTEIVELE